MLEFHEFSNARLQVEGKYTMQLSITDLFKCIGNETFYWLPTETSNVVLRQLCHRKAFVLPCPTHRCLIGIRAQLDFLV